VDLTGMADAHRAMHEYEKMWDFTTIADPVWRPVAKDLMIALHAPRHERVLALQAALRTVRSPRTCQKYLEELVSWFNWLTAKELDSLAGVTQDLCEEYLEQRSWSVPDRAGHRRRLAAGTLAEFVRVVQVVALYEDLFLADRYRPDSYPGRAAPHSW